MAIHDKPSSVIANHAFADFVYHINKLFPGSTDDYIIAQGEGPHIHTRPFSAFCNIRSRFDVEGISGVIIDNFLF